MNLNISKLSKFAQHQFAKITSKPSGLECVFVVGAPRSGTTLIQTRIAAHSGFASIQRETGFFRPDFYSRGLGKSFSNWGGLVKNFEAFVKTNADELTFVEKTPQHVKNLRWLLRYFPNARVIHVFRDPRDCLASAQTNKNIKHYESPRKFALYWNSCIKSRFQVAVQHPRVKDISYEQLVSRPSEILAEIMIFLGAGLENQQLKNVWDRRASNIAFHRLQQTIDDRSVGQWKNTLDLEAAEDTWRVSGRLHQKALQELVSSS